MTNLSIYFVIIIYLNKADFLRFLLLFFEDIRPNILTTEQKKKKKQ